MNHEQFLKQALQAHKMELDSMETEHRIAVAEHNVKKKILLAQINAIEKQLGNE